MSQTMQSGLTQVEIASQTTGLELTAQHGSCSSAAATTMKTVATGKIVKIYGFTHSFFNESTAENADSSLTAGGVVLSKIWHYPQGATSNAQMNFGENYVKLVEGDTITLSSFDVSHTAEATIFYTEEDA